jgi:GNAT superfamily N-acetyltransferase
MGKVLAMEIARGENLSLVQVKDLLNNSSAFKLATETKGSFTYRFGFHEYDTRNEKMLLILKEGAELVGLLQTGKSDLGKLGSKRCVSTDAIYVSPKYRNTGIGKQLVEEARRLLPDDMLLTSSSEIGTMAVRNWCALARKHTSIHMVQGHSKETVDADFSGSMPVIEDSGNAFELDEDPNGPPYYFVWPK